MSSIQSMVVGLGSLQESIPQRGENNEIIKYKKMVISLLARIKIALMKLGHQQITQWDCC